MDTIRYSIAKEFSRTPGPRYKWEGNFSGEEFRPQLLEKYNLAVSAGKKLEVNLDGTAGYGTSFLEESFGGLIRAEGKKYDDIIKTIIFISNEEPDLIEEILAYLKDAHEDSKK